MRHRLSALAAVAVLTIAVASGCTRPPEPIETSPAFASDEEAFAAAEATYRAYVDALNDVDLRDPATFEPVFALTTGEANANERERLSTMHADGWEVIGSTVLDSFGKQMAGGEIAGAVSAMACLNVAEVQVTDADGISQVSPDRRDRYALLVTFDFDGPELRVSSSNAIEDERCTV